ncbi:hypothetical protein [Maribacter antarcticus]|uniref:hypothetical protein n=1 Tax=Maribacter antarcticus TaxID=505250 RepID=UPI00047B30B4|nr:hypothetical protein [Maribacter antarcticus]
METRIYFTCNGSYLRNYILNYPEEETKKKLNDVWLENSNMDDIYFLDYSNNDKFNLKDYYDYIHLNSRGADKFSIILNQDISNLLKDKNASKF